MKIAVLSDTHGLLREQVKEIIGECEAIIHAGDINSQKILDQIAAAGQKNDPFYVVRGNNDKEWAKDIPETLEFELNHVKFFLVHNKKDIPEELGDIQIVIFGHSHKYSEEETNLLANAEADEIIKSYTFKELVDEVDALADIGVDNMTERDKIVFMKLAKERQRQEEQKDLLSLGINKKDIEDSEFKEFSNKLNPELSLKEKYELFLQVKPKKETKKMGSMQSGATSKVKDYYTAEEIERLTDEDLDNDAVWEAVRKSMTGQA